MPNIQSAKKRIKSDAKKRLRNRARKSAVATYEKSFEKAIAAGDVAAAEALLPTVISNYDKAVKSNVVSKAKADRKKSRLTVKLNAAKNA